MIYRITMICACLYLSLSMYAQAPQAFNYQGLARDESKIAVNLREITLQIDIIEGSIDGDIIYTESHRPMTNGFGIFNVRIGEGDVSIGDFENIQWGSGQYFIKSSIDIDGGSDFVAFEPVKLYSVPYALYAARSGSSTTGGEVQTLSLDGSILSIENGNSIDLTDLLSPGMIDTDTISAIQSLTLEDQVLSISGSNQVDLSVLSGDGVWTERDSSIFYQGNSMTFGSLSGTPIFTVFNNEELGAFAEIAGNPEFGSLLMSPADGILSLDASGSLNYSLGSFLGSGALNIYGSDILKAEVYEDFNGNGTINTYDSEGLQLISIESDGSEGELIIYGDDEELISMTGGMENGGMISIHNDSINNAVMISSLESKQGNVEINGPSGQANVLLRSTLENHNNGYLAVADEVGIERAGLYVDERGRGVIFADDIRSIIQDPASNKKNNTISLYAVQEGAPSISIRGTAKLTSGKAQIDFPLYFQNLACPHSMTVVVTPLSALSKGIAIVEKNLTGMRATELYEGLGNYNFDWEVNATKGPDCSQDLTEGIK